MKKFFLILSIIFRKVMVIDYGNPKIPNDCEKHFLMCPNSLERTDDCEYFLDNRCKYLYDKVDHLKRPVLYRRDHFDFTRYEGDLPYYKCLVLEHLKISWKRELNYQGNQKTKWITMVPSRAFPLDLLKRTFIQVDKTLPEKALWETEDMSDFSEFVYEYDEITACKDDPKNIQLKDIDGRHMAQEEFDLRGDRRKFHDLRMITIIFIKDDQQSCARIHPKYSNHNQQSNVVTYVVGSELAYPAYDRIAHMGSSPPPWAEDELRGRDSAWCRSRRLILGLSEATLRNKRGEKIADLTGPHFCSLFIWEQERVIRLTFKRNDQKYTVKVVLQFEDNSRSWTPLNVELNKKHEYGQDRLGDTIHFELENKTKFVKNDTFYSLESELRLGNEELMLGIGRLAVEFDPQESPFNFSVPFYNKRSSLAPLSSLSAYKPRSKASSRLSATKHLVLNSPDCYWVYSSQSYASGSSRSFGKPRSIALSKASSSTSNVLEERQKRYKKVGKRVTFVLVPFLVIVTLVALITTVLRLTQLRHWIYEKLMRSASPPKPLGLTQRLLLAAQYAREQAANMAIYTLEGIALATALHTLCGVRDRLLAAARAAPGVLDRR